VLVLVLVVLVLVLMLGLVLVFVLCLTQLLLVLLLLQAQLYHDSPPGPVAQDSNRSWSREYLPNVVPMPDSCPQSALAVDFVELQAGGRTGRRGLHDPEAPYVPHCAINASVDPETGTSQPLCDEIVRNLALKRMAQVFYIRIAAPAVYIRIAAPAVDIKRMSCAARGRREAVVPRRRHPQAAPRLGLP